MCIRDSFQTTANTSEGAVFAYLGVPGTTVYYATTATDTNQAGLPFPNINLASYPSLNFSADIAPSFAASNVTAYAAVQLNGTDWYVAASSLAVPTTTDSPTYANYTLAFNPAAANWKNLTVTGSGGLVDVYKRQLYDFKTPSDASWRPVASIPGFHLD